MKPIRFYHTWEAKRGYYLLSSFVMLVVSLMAGLYFNLGNFVSNIAATIFGITLTESVLTVVTGHIKGYRNKVVRSEKWTWIAGRVDSSLREAIISLAIAHCKLSGKANSETEAKQCLFSPNGISPTVGKLSAYFFKCISLAKITVMGRDEAIQYQHNIDVALDQFMSSWSSIRSTLDQLLMATDDYHLLTSANKVEHYIHWTKDSLLNASIHKEPDVLIRNAVFYLGSTCLAASQLYDLLNEYDPSYFEGDAPA